jgi:hypothetical protein
VFREKEMEPETNNERKGRDKEIKVNMNEPALVQ